MARPLRVEFPGAIYHVIVRGNARAIIFTDDNEREWFLNRLSELVKNYNIRLYLFVLMSTHLHMVIETPNANLSRFMQSLLTGYSIYFNRRHNRRGHLTEGRYKAKLVAGDKYLLKLTRYVHLNPVFTEDTTKLKVSERIRLLRAYQWSSYPGYIGINPPVDFVDYGPMLAYMDGNHIEQQVRYRQFVESDLSVTDEELAEVLHKSPLCIGDKNFRTRIESIHNPLNLLEDKVLTFRRVMGNLSPDVILDAIVETFQIDHKDLLICKRGSPVRGVSALFLSMYGGMKKRDIADLLGLQSGAGVNYQKRKAKERISKDKNLERLVKDLENTLRWKRRDLS